MDSVKKDFSTAEGRAERAAAEEKLPKQPEHPGRVGGWGVGGIHMLMSWHREAAAQDNSSLSPGMANDPII